MTILAPIQRHTQNPANRGAADLKAAGDFGFADAGAMQFPDFRSVYGRGCRPAQPFPVLPGWAKPSPRSFPQNLPFELGEDGQQSGHGATGWCGQIQRLGQGNEPDAEMFQFLKSCQQICH